MANLDKFRYKLRQYRIVVAHSQEDLAVCIGLHPTVLSNKLRGTKQAYLTRPEIKAIIRQLAEWEALQHRNQALELLELMDLPATSFSATEWNSWPLNRLTTEPSLQSIPENVRIPSLEANEPGVNPQGHQIEPPPCPYRGLFAFRKEDASFFFGRENIALRMAKAVQNQSLLAVVGPSGSGKSSVVFAGLLPALPEDWLYSTFRPGERPLRALAKSLIPLLEPDLHETDRLVEMNKLALALEKREVSLMDVVEQIVERQQAPNNLLEQCPKPRLVLVADQFEELFSLCRDEGERACFLEHLLNLVEGQAFRAAPLACIVLTFRADFLNLALSYRPLADALQDGLVALGPLNRAELEAAIVEPARCLGVELEKGLAGRIIEAVIARTGSMPLLEFTLTLLWERLSGRKLTHAAYEEIGGVEQALANQAEAVFTALDLSKQAKAQRLFLQLVRPGEATEDTRRIATRAELGEESWELVNQLVNARLVVTDLDEIRGVETVELVHEALLSHWDRLKSWIDADREFRLWQERLRISVSQWQTGGRDEGALLRGRLLGQAEEWLTHRGNDLTPVERDFILAGQALQIYEEGRIRRIRRLSGLGLSIGITLVLIFGVIALLQSATATEQRNNALNSEATAVSEAKVRATAQAKAEAGRQQMLARQLISQAHTNIEGQLDLAALLSLEAGRLSNQSQEARNSLFEVVSQTPRLLSFLPGQVGSVSTVAYSPDGKILVSCGLDGTIWFWDATTSQPLGPPIKAHEGGVTSLVFSPNGKILASAGVDKLIRLWDVLARQPIGSVLRGHSDEVIALAFSPDGKILVSGSFDKTLRRWDAASWQPIGTPLANDFGTVRALSFSPDGKILAVSYLDSYQKDIVLWDTSNWQPTLLKTNSSGCDCSFVLTFSPDGKLLAFGDWSDKNIRLWDISAGRLRFPPLIGHSSTISALAFSPDGKILASGGLDNTIRLWDVNSGQPLSEPFLGHKAVINRLAFSPDGKTLVSGSDDGTVRLWQVELDKPTWNIVNESFFGLALSADNKILAAGSSNGLIYLWNTQTRQAVASPLKGHQGAVYALAFSPDGRWLASGGKDATIRLWDTRTWQAVGPIVNVKRSWLSAISNIAFSPDSKFLLGSSPDASLWRWEIASAAFENAPKTAWFECGECNILGMALSPDGRSLAYSTSSGYLIRGLDVATLAPQFYPQGHMEPVRSVVFSPDGKLIVSGSDDKTIRLWDNQTHQLLGLPLVAHTAAVNRVIFSPDGQWLASASDDSSVRLWDVAQRQTIGSPLVGHRAEVINLVFSLDGKSLYSAGSDGTIRIWNMDYESWQVQACRIANRNLTQEEWKQYLGDSEPYRQTCSGKY